MDERGADVLSGLDLEDEEVRAEYGDLIHENWISRNEWVKIQVLIYLCYNSGYE